MRTLIRRVTDERAPAAGALQTALSRAPALLAFVLALPVLHGIWWTMGMLVQTEHPATSVIGIDAQAVALGLPLYQDPADGFTAWPYTPLFSYAAGLLMKIEHWAGWALVLSTVASLLTAGLVGAVAYRRGRSPGETLLALLGAVGIAGLSWWLVMLVNVEFAYTDWPEHFAWLPGLGALVLLARLGPSGRGLLVTGALLSLAFWSKQTTVTAAAAATAWLLLASAAGAMPLRRVVAFIAGMVVVNGLVFAVYAWVTDGWAVFFLAELPAAQPLTELADTFIGHLRLLRGELEQRTALLLLTTVGVWAAVAVGRRGSHASTSGDIPARRVLAAASVIGLLLAAGAAYFAEKSTIYYAFSGPVANDATFRPWAVMLVGQAVLASTVLVAIAASRYRLVPQLVAGRLAVAVAVLAGALAAALFHLVLRAPVTDELGPTGGALLLLLADAAVFVSTALVLMSAAAQLRSSSPDPRPLSQWRHLLGRWFATSSFDHSLLSVLAVFIPLQLVALAYFRAKLGAGANHYFPFAWALALLMAVGFRWAQATARGRLVVMAVLAGLAAAQLAPLQDAINRFGWSVTETERRGDIDNVPENLLSLASRMRVYHFGLEDLNVPARGELWASAGKFSYLLAAGQQPVALRDALLERRFGAVFLLPPDREDDYISSSKGLFEESYGWKLNRVMRAKYRPGPGPDGVRYRVPGKDPAPWMNRCFGPFRLAGVAWRINRGGGFWCRYGQELHLGPIPGQFSDLRTDGRVAGIEGSLAIRIRRRSGSWTLTLERSDGRTFAIRGERAVDGMTVGLFDPEAGTVHDEVTVPARSEGLHLDVRTEGGETPGIAATAEGHVTLWVPDLGDEGAVLRVAASKGSEARFSFAALRLRAAAD